MWFVLQETGTWDKISSHKHIVSEPRSGGKEGLYISGIFYMLYI